MVAQHKFWCFHLSNWVLDMKQQLNTGDVFIFYDEPQVFLLSSEYDELYLAVLGEDEVPHGFAYAAFPVTEKQLLGFTNGQVGLLETILPLYRGFWFGFNTFDPAAIEAEIQYSIEPPAQYLPEAGLTISPIKNFNPGLVRAA